MYNPNDKYDKSKGIADDIDGEPMDVDHKPEDVDVPEKGPRSMCSPVTWLISFLSLCFQVSSKLFGKDDL